ncbi:MAG: hypothetical protein JRH19_07540 [Deltaproteobacteria bacterium]|nr:hypothetical protein [Deltaproteobacteria bacterium]
MSNRTGRSARVDTGAYAEGSKKMFRGRIDHRDLTVMDPAASEPFHRAVLGCMGFEPVRLSHGATHLRIIQATDAGQRLFSVALPPLGPSGPTCRKRTCRTLRKRRLKFVSSTDILAAKDVLRDPLCLKGDVPAALLSIGTPAEVEAYCSRLINRVGDGRGFILSSDCGVPADARPENFRAMIETGKHHTPS